MEHAAHPAVATFFATDELVAGRTATLGEWEAHHARVRRLVIGDHIRLVNGEGAVGRGVLLKLSRAQAVVQVDAVMHVDPLPAVHLVVPIADRDRMLWLAEKATELGVASWRPALWRRSRSVSPRGEGNGFHAKVRARMTMALTQSGGAWLPMLYPDAPLDRVIAACPAGARFLLDAEGAPLPSHPLAAPVALAVGPEGGVEAAERDQFLAGGFVPASLGPLTLRFETAAVAAVAITRSALTVQLENAGG